jgi:hypothetical protein
MAKPLFVVIGVHKAAGMPVLEGVLNSLDDLSSWAKRQGYEIVSIEDRATRVTVNRIKEELTPLLDQETGERDLKRLLDRPRIVVYFCGHGLHASGDQYWILSAGPNQPDERISAVGLRDMLAKYGPKQIAVISGACRSAQVVQGLASSVVEANDALAGVVHKDNFFSAQDGEASFAVPANQGIPAHCVFSNVLLRALSEPVDPEALDPLYMETGRRIVSSQSLATYLEKKVPEAALGVGRLQAPECNPGFRPYNNDYVEFGEVAGVAVSPAEAKARTAERIAAQNGRINRSLSEWRRPYVEKLQNYMGPQLSECLRKYNRGPLFLSSNIPYSDFSIVVKGQIQTQTAVPTDLIVLPQHAVTRHNWIAAPILGFVDTPRSSVAVVRVKDFYTAAPIHRRLWCAVIVDEQPGDTPEKGGVELIAWGVEAPSPAQRLSSAEALKGLSSRTLNAEDTAVLAEELRYLKHVDPMYGVVSAYLYNSIGDVANIRRMCFYYQQNNQDVPFDIAMLTQLELKQGSDARFFVNVPKVAETPKAQRREGAPPFVWESTPLTEVAVAGITPLLRVVWQHIQASPYDVHKKCSELAGHLTESPIATLRGHEAGARLVEILREF